MRTKRIPAHTLHVTDLLVETINGRRHPRKVCEVIVDDEMRTTARVRIDDKVARRPVVTVELTGGKTLEKPGFWRPSDQVQVQTL